jgi:hypothetical protein
MPESGSITSLLWPAEYGCLLRSQVISNLGWTLIVTYFWADNTNFIMHLRLLLRMYGHGRTRVHDLLEFLFIFTFVFSRNYYIYEWANKNLRHASRQPKDTSHFPHRRHRGLVDWIRLQHHDDQSAFLEVHFEPELQISDLLAGR